MPQFIVQRDAAGKCHMEFDFAANTKVADINKIPQDFRGLYKQDGENHILDTEHPGVKSAIAAISGLNNALKASRAEAKNKPAAVDLAPLKEYGDNPATIHDNIQKKIKELSEQIKGVNLEKIKADLAGEYTGKITASEKKQTALQQQLYKHLVLGEATGAIAQEKGDVELLMPFVREQVKVTENGSTGEAIVHVVDKSGDIRYSGVTGAPMSIKELVKEMKGHDRFAKLFASEAASGAATNAAAGQRQAAAAAGRAAAGEQRSPNQKIASGLGKLIGKR